MDNLVESRPDLVHELHATAIDELRNAITARIDWISLTVQRTLQGSDSLSEIVATFLDWMRSGSVVRVLGAGRARLAAALPANRLAHGGARVYVQGDLSPMPSSWQGGGLLAASASGRTRSVLDSLRELRSVAPHIRVVGIAGEKAHVFHDLCHFSIRIREAKAPRPCLTALNDIAELAMVEILDALVVAAGRAGGFDDRKWRFGHEDIAETGPYSVGLG